MSKDELQTDGRFEGGDGAPVGEKAGGQGGEEGGELSLEEQIAGLRDQLAEAENKALRALADYQNFQRRAANNEREARTRGTRDVLESLLPVLDNADIALSQDPEKLTVESLVGGVKLIRDGVIQAMTRHGVVAIAPEVGDEFEPGRHEAIMRQPTADVASGRVAMMLQVGYSIGEQVVRPAKVGVAVAPVDPDAEGA